MFVNLQGHAVAAMSYVADQVRGWAARNNVLWPYHHPVTHVLTLPPQVSIATCLSSDRATEYLRTVLQKHHLAMTDAAPHSDMPRVVSELHAAATALQKEMERIARREHADDGSEAVPFLGEKC